MNEQRLKHTRCNCKYHIVFAPKFRRKLIYCEHRKAIGDILRKLWEYRGIEIVKTNACVDYIHICIKTPPKYSVHRLWVL